MAANSGFTFAAAARVAGPENTSEVVGESEARDDAALVENPRDEPSSSNSQAGDMSSAAQDSQVAAGGILGVELASVLRTVERLEWDDAILPSWADDLWPKGDDDSVTQVLRHLPPRLNRGLARDEAGSIAYHGRWPTLRKAGRRRR